MIKKRLTKKQKEQRSKWKEELDLITKSINEGATKTRTIAQRELWLKLKLYGKEQPKLVNRGLAVTKTGTFVIRGYK
ncbi:hypothetical protein D3C77_318100 [compost metagenome]